MTAPSPNAKTMEETTAKGSETFGVLNQHPVTATLSSSIDVPTTTVTSAVIPTQSDSTVGPGFKVGVSVDKNKKCRRTMEDAHSFIYDFGGIRGQGYFAVFDGHAGKHAAEWCGEHFHEHLLSSIRAPHSPPLPIPDLLNATFHTVDAQLSTLAQAQGTHSGCTAVTVFLRLEHSNGDPVGKGSGVSDDVFNATDSPATSSSPSNAFQGAEEVNQDTLDVGAPLERSHELQSAQQASQRDEHDQIDEAAAEEQKKPKMFTGEGVFRDKLKGLIGVGSVAKEFVSDPKQVEEQKQRQADSVVAATPKIEIQSPAQVLTAAKRTLYTANVGDARAVLSRGGKAIRLTYDHKGSDVQEAKRITDAGGFVMNNRVNGVLAVTRSLGDSSMKQFVVGSPYTTETTLGDEDEWLIVACDGLWDVCEDQDAVDIIKATSDPQAASKALLDHALQNFSSDNLSVLVVSLRDS